MLIFKTHTVSTKYAYKVRRQKNICHNNSHQKKVEVAIYESHKVDCRTRNITKDKKRHRMLIKESIHQKDKIILNVFAPSIKASIHME